jgi:hypothetical protein
MINPQRNDTSLLLNETAQALDISDSLFEEVEKKYKAVGTWLGEGNSPLAIYSPQIYPQGSFRLGLVVKPLSDIDEYDIDLVFELAIPKNRLTQKELKKMVGDRLKEHDMYREMLQEEKRRCWTLKYAESSQFHLDILPAVPNYDQSVRLKEQGVPPNLAQTSIAITDNTSPNFEKLTLDWPRSNPKGYSAWFRERMIVQYEEIRKYLTESFKAQVDNVPEYRIKTPLQRCIQLLKRHRDIVFKNDSENKPASIIITTLAGLAYNNEADLTASLINIVEGMPKNIAVRNGIYWVANPVDSAENFADKWKDNPNREPSFRNWLQKVHWDLIRLQSCTDLESKEKLLSELFGERTSMIAMNSFKEFSSSGGSNLNVITPKSPPVVLITRPNQPWGL